MLIQNPSILEPHLPEILRIVSGDYKTVPAEIFLKTLDCVELPPAMAEKIRTVQEMNTFRRPTGRKKEKV